MMVMVDEATGNKYMRVVAHKGLGGEGDISWLVKEMQQELKPWGHPGGGSNAVTLKSDGEPDIVAVRGALARCHGCLISPAPPPVGEWVLCGCCAQSLLVWGVGALSGWAASKVGGCAAASSSRWHRAIVGCGRRGDGTNYGRRVLRNERPAGG